MIAPFIALQNQGGTPQMIRYAGASSSFVGNSFGTADVVGGASNEIQPAGRVIRFGGLNTYLAATGTNIWRTTNGGTTWTAVYTFTSMTQTANKSGFAVIYLNGIPAVNIIWINSSNELRNAFSFDGVTWTTQGPFTFVNLGGTELGLNEQVVSGSTIYCATPREMIISIPGANNITNTGLSGQQLNVWGVAVCEFNNRIFTLYIQTASTTLTIGELVGTTPSVIASLRTGLTPINDHGIGALFVDGANMFAIAPTGTGGLRCYQLSSALAVTEITTTVIPTTLSGASLAAEARARVVIDGVSSPGSAPTIYVFFASNATSLWAVYQWNGNAAQMTLVSQGGSTRHSIPFFDNVTGTYFVADSVFPSTDSISVEVTNRIFTATGVRLSFKIYGTSAGGAVSFRVYVGDSNAEYPTTAGTLTNPSVGAISGGNINTGLTADNGVTTYQVTWAAQTDGFATNSEFRLVGDAFV